MVRADDQVDKENDCCVETSLASRPVDRRCLFVRWKENGTLEEKRTKWDDETKRDETRRNETKERERNGTERNGTAIVGGWCLGCWLSRVKSSRVELSCCIHLRAVAIDVASCLRSDWTDPALFTSSFSFLSLPLSLLSSHFCLSFLSSAFSLHSVFF